MVTYKLPQTDGIMQKICISLVDTLRYISFALTVYPKNFHDSSDICPMGFMYSIQIREISHRTFGPSHRKCPTCPMIFVNTALTNQNQVDILVFPTACAQFIETYHRWTVANLNKANNNIWCRQLSYQKAMDPFHTRTMSLSLKSCENLYYSNFDYDYSIMS